MKVVVIVLHLYEISKIIYLTCSKLIHLKRLFSSFYSDYLHVMSKYLAVIKWLNNICTQ